MVHNATNIYKTNNYLSPQTILTHKKTHQTILTQKKPHDIGLSVQHFTPK